MKVLLDANIVLDLLLAREPFVHNAKEIFLMIENQEIQGCLCATSITTLHYLVGKQIGQSQADEVIADLLKIFDIAPVDKEILLKALQYNGNDYEDSIIYVATEEMLIDTIITRDKRGFKRSNTRVMLPEEFLAIKRS